MSARELLGPDGPLARAMDRYEARPGQLDMADAVERALAEDRVLLCEAGTGTGKTLAYLVPALRSGRRVVVSTASRALQEQIFHKDLALARACAGVDVEARLVKGLGNYLCRRRFAELRANIAGAKPEVRRALPLLESWAAETSQGDIAEVDALSEDHAIWREVVSSPQTRIGARCNEYEACHATHMKREAEQAQLIVVNHHLFLADLAIRGAHAGAVLPPYDAVILDEAHRLEDIATLFFGAHVSSGSIDRLLVDATRSLHRGDEPPPVAAVRTRAVAWLAALNLLATGERQALPHDAWTGALLERYHALDDALEALASSALEAEAEPATITARRATTLRDDLARIVDSSTTNVSWVMRQAGGISVSSSPVDVGPMLRERLFSRGQPVVLTSASLSTGGDFRFVRSRLGLDEGIEAPVDQLTVRSPIDHRGQALLYVPRDLPTVDDRSFAAHAARRVAELRALCPGGAFVLCTSLRAMNALSDALRAHVTDAPMVQGSAPKAALLERFRAAGNALLVATMSFWEGVDVPGEALSLVVIDRLPFPVPSDPLHAARCKALEQQGHKPFSRYTLPRAAITLKQGFGRLLRSRRDEGVVAIFDQRIHTRGYGAELLESLPDVACTSALDDVVAFWDRRHTW